MLLCAVVFAIASIPVCAHNTVYVRPEYYYGRCPGEPCYPLSYYQQRVPQYFMSDISDVLEWHTLPRGLATIGYKEY